MESMFCFLESFTIFPHDFICFEREIYLWLSKYRKQKEKMQVLKLSIRQA